MEIFHDDDNNCFKAFDGNAVLIGQINYVPTPDAMIANHTHVEAEFQGQGVGKRLLDALVDYAKEEHKKIIPVCSFVAESFDRNPELYREVAIG